LVIRRKGRLDLPKGKVDADETVNDGAIREVMEECGLARVELARPLTVTWHTYERKGRQWLKRTDWFLMRASSRQPTEPEAEEFIEEVMWFKRDEVREMRHETYPSLRRVLNAWAVAVK
jgi:8-oxo-dGTP pyrophosphatase MutT (NUDIX family)